MMIRNENFLSASRHAEIATFILSTIIFLTSGWFYFFGLCSAISVTRWILIRNINLEKSSNSNKYELLSREVFAFLYTIGVNVAKKRENRHEVDKEINASKTFSEAFDAYFDIPRLLFALIVMALPHFSKNPMQNGNFHILQIMDLLFYIVAFRIVSLIAFKILIKTGIVK